MNRLNFNSVRIPIFLLLVSLFIFTGCGLYSRITNKHTTKSNFEDKTIILDTAHVTKTATSHIIEGTSTSIIVDLEKSNIIESADSIRILEVETVDSTGTRVKSRDIIIYSPKRDENKLKILADVEYVKDSAEDSKYIYDSTSISNIKKDIKDQLSESISDTTIHSWTLPWYIWVIGAIIIILILIFISYKVWQWIKLKILKV